MKEYFTSKGRLSRLSYWKFMAPVIALFLMLGGISSELIQDESTKSGIGLFVFPLILVAMIVQIKRWHDLNKSGWWVLINLIPIIGPIWAIIETGFFEGTPGINSYGENPI